MNRFKIAILALAFGLLCGPILVSCSKETSEPTANVVQVEFQCSSDCVLTVGDYVFELQGRDEFVLLELPETEKGAAYGTIAMYADYDIADVRAYTLRGTTVSLERATEPGGRIYWKAGFRFIEQDRVWLVAF